jgi:thiosulfate/3-mercaptopyruvate sulfurtransferase
MKINNPLLNFTLLIAVSGLVLSARIGGASDLKSKGMPPSEWLVSVDWLKDHVNDKDLIIVDARSEKEYAQGHLPNAIRLDLSDLSAKTNELGLQELNKALSEKFSILGITGAEQVIIYDEANATRGPRALWFLTYAGYTKGRVLYGGLASWQESSFPLSWDRRAREPRPFVVKPNPEVLATTDYVAKRIKNAGVLILDVRSRQEYSGNEPSKPGERTGHIPGAVWFEWTNLLDDKLRYLPLADLQKKLFEAGITPDKEIITYCQAGNRSCNTYLALRSLGYPRVKNYIGSWKEWVTRLDLPIEKGEPATSQ